MAAFASYIRLAVGIGGNQPVADIGDIELAVGEVLPGMRVGYFLLVAMFALGVLDMVFLGGTMLWPSSSIMVRGATPVLATTTLPLKPDDFSRRSIQPSKPRPLTKKISAPASLLASAGSG